MKKVTLRIENPFEREIVALEDEISIGRTDAARVVLSDTGLSRRNTTFFRDGDAVYVVDENSLNGTFIAGERISGAPVRVFDGDVVTLGSETRISIEIREREEAAASHHPQTSAPTAGTAKPKTKSQKPKAKNPQSKSNQTPLLLIGAIGSAVVILILGVAAILIANNIQGGGSGTNSVKPPPQAVQAALIPVRVIDPLGGEDPDDLDDLIASWETEEKELDVSTVQDVKITAPDATKEDEELNVTAAELAEAKQKAFAPRSKPTGITPPGLQVPPELRGDGVIKQKAKLGQMMRTVPPYQQPMDFSDLAQKRLNRELIEMPMATKSFYLEVGGSASSEAFTAFSFAAGETPILQGSPKHKPLTELAAKFGVSLDNPTDRKQIRMRLLRMFNKGAKPVLQELSDAYFQKFGRPLRVTSLTRSMDYQIGLNKTNANSFIVRGEGSLPPHTSGCAFDLARKHMDVEEQNFVMAKLAEMERAKKLDALIEYGTNACFHIFIYFDGIAPNM
jgi:pSer/pThr/pTyr-binding forkhead associated (FHA) protein